MSQPLNNLDIVILIMLGISALIALSRGLMKEVLSIIGWVLGSAAVIYFLPVFTPITKEYIASGMIAGVVTSIFILILFMVIWILLTGNIVDKIRSSKLSSLDRMLGLFFGIMRAFLLVILLNILISWIMPKERQPETFKNSKYFQLAGEFAEPIENLIPKETLDSIKEKAATISGKEEKSEEDETQEEPKEEPKEEKTGKSSDDLFEKLAQPQVKSKKKAKDEQKSQPLQEDFDGYNVHERTNLDRLIENSLD